MYEIEPYEITGIPRTNVASFSYVPPDWVLCLKKNPGILFIDEILNTDRPDQISVGYKLALDRIAGFTKLSDEVMIVAAANPPEFSSISQEPPWPLLDRFIVININISDKLSYINEWANYMQQKYNNAWERRILAYLRTSPSDILVVPKEPFEKTPTPRSWTKVAVLLFSLRHSKISWEEKEAIISGILAIFTAYLTKVTI